MKVGEGKGYFILVPPMSNILIQCPVYRSTRHWRHPSQRLSLYNNYGVQPTLKKNLSLSQYSLLERIRFNNNLVLLKYHKPINVSPLFVRKCVRNTLASLSQCLLIMFMNMSAVCLNPCSTSLLLYRPHESH